MGKIRIDNINISELINLLTTLSHDYEIIDLVVDSEEKRISVEPVELENESRNNNKIIMDQFEEITNTLTDDDINKII